MLKISFKHGASYVSSYITSYITKSPMNENRTDGQSLSIESFQLTYINLSGAVSHFRYEKFPFLT